jgi:hypothetical protein
MPISDFSRCSLGESILREKKKANTNPMMILGDNQSNKRNKRIQIPGETSS